MIHTQMPFAVIEGVANYSPSKYKISSTKSRRKTNSRSLKDYKGERNKNKISKNQKRE